MGMNEFAVLVTLGIRVVEIASLGAHSVWVNGYDVLLIDAGLDDHQREAVACRALARVQLR